MIQKRAQLTILALVALAIVTGGMRFVVASDHDDGENDSKSRALNLTDHYVWKDDTDPTKVNFAQSSSPRSLPQYAYFFSTQARYEIHVSRVANKALTDAAPKDDIVYRFEFGAPNATTGAQPITFTVLESGVVKGTDSTGLTTNYASSYASGTSASQLTINNLTVDGKTYKLFAGLREDTFYFDVQRYFQVRAFLANAFVSGKAATTVLADFQANQKTCDGKALGEAGGDGVHLFNPPSCAPDFTKGYNVNQIVLQASIGGLGGTVLDTWSTISIPQ